MEHIGQWFKLLKHAYADMFLCTVWFIGARCSFFLEFYFTIVATFYYNALLYVCIDMQHIVLDVKID